MDGFVRVRYPAPHHDTTEARRPARTGIWGDATLATREKGRQVVEAMVEGMLQEIEAFRAQSITK